MYEPRRSDQVSCSLYCRRARHKRQAAAQVAVRRRRYPFPPGPCPICGGVRKYPDKAKTCSYTCGQELKRHQAEAAVEEVAARIPDTVNPKVCTTCRGTYRHAFDWLGRATLVCGCGEHLVPIERPADFRRYEASDKRLRAIEGKVDSECTPVGERGHGSGKKMRDVMFISRRTSEAIL